MAWTSSGDRILPDVLLGVRGGPVLLVEFNVDGRVLDDLDAVFGDRVCFLEL